MFSQRCIACFSWVDGTNPIRAAFRGIAQFCSQKFADRRKHPETIEPSRARARGTVARLASQTHREELRLLANGQSVANGVVQERPAENVRRVAAHRCQFA
jgi:hypothetical protein